MSHRDTQYYSWNQPAKQHKIDDRIFTIYPYNSTESLPSYHLCMVIDSFAYWVPMEMVQYLANREVK